MWKKQGLIFKTKGQAPWMVSHACVPTAMPFKEENKIRLFFAPRDKNGKSIPTFMDLNGSNPTEVLHLQTEPILELGELGTFDDDGIMPCSVVKHEGKIYMYYVGWNPTVSVPYRNAIGLAISEDYGRTFQRYCKGPIVDRNMDEPYFTAAPCVMKEQDNWHMWYASSTGFVEVNDTPEPLYVIKYASSKDGIHWDRNNQTCIEPKDKYEANSRATVIKENGLYKMWFTYRGSFDYRNGKDSYRIGYAESKDAIHWNRMDQKAGISYSETGWDSKMQTYPNVLDFNEKRYLFYNGNGFGESGIGYAIWEK